MNQLGPIDIAREGSPRDTATDALPMPWWTKRGAVVALAVLLFFLLGAFFFFPIAPVMTAPVTIGSAGQPSLVESPSQGTLLAVYQTNGSRVEAGALLALVGEPGDVERLEMARRYARAPAAEYPANARVPSQLAPTYAALMRASLERRRLESGIEQAALITELRIRVADAASRRELVERRRRNLEQSQAIQQRAYDRTQELVDRGFYSPAALDRARGTLLSHENDLLQSRVDAENANSELIRLRASISALEGNHGEALQRQIALEHIAHLEFVGALEAWELSHLVLASTAGTIHYFRRVQDGIDVEVAERLGLITDGSSDYQAIAYLPAARARKPSVGQSVTINVGQSAGTVRVRGVVDYVSPYIREGVYYVTISLPSELAYVQGMPATAEFTPGYTTVFTWLLHLSA